MAALVDVISVLALYLVYTADAACPVGFERHSNACYKASGLEASWAEAKMYCRFMGTELAIVDSAEEEATIEGILTRLHGAHIDESYWIAGADIASEGQFMWMAGDGVMTPITNYTNWASGAPDNFGGQQNCIVIRYHGARTKWNDESCDNKHSFVCEVSDETDGTDGPIAVG